MKKNVQLTIQNPCNEDWAVMRPEEKGRFCSSCCKTVVDFSLMSDREVLNYLGGTDGKVCGRFAGDQLQRDLMAPPQRKRKGWMVWNIVMMILLLASKTRGQGKAPRPVSHQIDPGKDVKHPILMGTPVSLVVGEIERSRPEQDTVPRVPHYTELPTVVVTGYGSATRKVVLGGATTSGLLVTCSKTKTFIQRIIPDTLDFLGIGKKALSLFPNPAERGTTIRLSLNMGGSGNCTIGLYNEAGMLIQIKAMKMTGDPRVELFNLPSSMPGGLYFVRVSVPGLKEYTQKLIVL